LHLAVTLTVDFSGLKTPPLQNKRYDRQNEKPRAQPNHEPGKPVGLEPSKPIFEGRLRKILIPIQPTFNPL
jgi:hypothetical protein